MPGGWHAIIFAALIVMAPAAHAGLGQERDVKIPPEDLVQFPSYRKPVHVDVVAPDEVLVSKIFHVDAVVRNLLDIPVLATVELATETDNVCAIENAAMASPALQVRQHEYLLAPQGGGLVSTDDDLGFLNGDTVTLSAQVAANAAGACRMAVIVSVQTVAGLSSLIPIKMTFETTVKLPSTEANLGGFVAATAGGCTSGTDRLVAADVPSSLTVAAGMVDVTAQLGWNEACVDNKAFSVMVIEQEMPDGTWEPVAASMIADDGTDVASTKVDLESGTHTFRMTATYISKWFTPTWGCFKALLEAGAAFLAAIALGIVPEPFFSKLAFAAAIILAIATAIGALFACTTVEETKTSSSVTVEAMDVSDTLSKLVGVPAGILEDPVGI